MSSIPDSTAHDAALAQLQDAVGSGQIDLNEFEERSAMLLDDNPAAISRALEGLPQAKTASIATRSAGTGPSPTGAAAPARTMPRPVSSRSVRQLHNKELKVEVATWVAVSLIVLTIWGIIAVTATPTYFWPAWVIGPWGALLAGRTLIERATRERPQDGLAPAGRPELY